MPFGLRPGFPEADADGVLVVDDAALALALVVAVDAALAVVIAEGNADIAGFVVVGAGFGPRPKSCGARQSTMPRPMRLTRMSIAENTMSFCRVDGPRARTTTVGVRGRRGRSGMRIVSSG